MQHAGHQYGQRAVPSSFQQPPQPQANASVTSSLRQWRKKDAAQQPPAAPEHPVDVEDPGLVARVAPQAHYARFPAPFPEFGVPYKDSHPGECPVKYSEIVENLPDAKMCSVQQPHLNYKQNYPPDPQLFPYLQKESHQYHPKDNQQYQQVPPKYPQPPPQQQYMRNYASSAETNHFLNTLNKLNPQFTQTIINDQHIRDTQVSMYQRSLEQPPPGYPHSQRMFRGSPPVPNYRQAFPNYPPQYGYRLPQYHHPQSYREMGYMGPQLEYAQHYQHRRSMQPPDYYQQQQQQQHQQQQAQFKGVYEQQDAPSNSLKQFLENWNEEDVATVSLPDLIVSSTNADHDNKLQLVKGTVRVKEDGTSETPLYVFDTTEISRDNLPQYLHLQVDKLPENVRGFYDNNASVAVIKTDERVNVIENRQIQPPNANESVVNLHIVETEDGETNATAVTETVWSGSPKNMPDINEIPPTNGTEDKNNNNCFQNFAEFQKKFATFVERVKDNRSPKKTDAPDVKEKTYSDQATETDEMEAKEVHEKDTQCEPSDVDEILVETADSYRRALKIDCSSVLLYIDDELVELNVDTLDGKKVISVVPLTGTLPPLEDDEEVDEIAEEAVIEDVSEELIENDSETVETTPVDDIGNEEEVDSPIEEEIIPEDVDDAPKQTEPQPTPQSQEREQETATVEPPSSTILTKASKKHFEDEDETVNPPKRRVTFSEEPATVINTSDSNQRDSDSNPHDSDSNPHDSINVQINLDLLDKDVPLPRQSPPPLAKKTTESRMHLNKTGVLRVYSRESAQKRRLSLQEYNSRKRRPIVRQTSVSAPPSIDVNAFDIAPIEDEIDLKLNPSVDTVRLPDPTPPATRADLIKENDLLMRKFLNKDKLTPVEMQKVKDIIKCKRMMEQISKAKRLKQAAGKPKKRFRNLYTAVSDSEGEDTKRASYLMAYQGQVANGIPKIIIKRKLKALQPFVKLERSPVIDSLAKRRKFSLILK